MRALCNGKEREVNDWHGLLLEADPRFRIRSAKSLPGLDLGIVDVEWNDEGNTG